MEPVVQNERFGERVVNAATPVGRANRFPAIAWSAIIGGLVVGLATQMVLMLLGIAAGLTAVDISGAGAGVRNVPAWSAVWNGLSMLVAAFVGGYVAARMSGLRRKSDGILHGFVAWGATTLLYAILAFSAMGALFGGVFNTIGGMASTGAQAVQGQGVEGLQQRLQSLIGENTEINTQALTTENMSQLQDRIQQGDRQGAVDFMVETFGVEQQNAEAVVDQAMVITGSPEAASPQARQQINQGIDVAATATWSLFIAVALSLIVALGGGLLGAKGAQRRPHHVARAA